MKKVNKKNYRIPLRWDIDELPINFPKQIRNIYERVYKENRKTYTSWIDKIGKKFRQDIDWWMTSVSFRNPYVSNLLNYTTVLETLSRVDVYNLKIITSSKKMAKILLNHSERKKLNVEVEIKKKSYFFKKLINILKSFFFHLVIIIYVKSFVKKNKPEYSKKIILIDTFITLKKNQNENYYPKFNNKNKNIFIVPTFLPTFNFFRLFEIIQSLKRKNEKYLFKEHYLGLNDLIFAFLHLFRRGKFCKAKYQFKNFVLTDLINEEINNYLDFYSINIGILNYLFFKNLSKQNLNVYKSINWFENQIVDKGWNLGFRKFFPNFEKNSYGYQDFNRHYNLISNSASPMEYHSKVTPENIILITSFFNKISKEFYKKQKTILGDSRRFKDILKFKKNSNKRKKNLLILSGIKNIDAVLLKFTNQVCKKNKNIKIYVKAHPILDIKKITSRKNFPENMIFTNDKLQKILNNTFIAITSGPSSAIFESACMGAILILPNIEPGTKENPKNLGLNSKNYFVINNSNEMLNRINFAMKNRKKFKNIKKNLMSKRGKSFSKIF